MPPLGLGEGCLYPRNTVHLGSEHQPLAPLAGPALSSWGVSWPQCTEMPAPWRGAPAGDAHTFLPPGAWSKPSRAVRMREKRADFVAGCLGGRVVAVGGLGKGSRGMWWCSRPHPLWHISDLCGGTEVSSAKPWWYCNTLGSHVALALPAVSLLCPLSAGGTLLPCPARLSWLSVQPARLTQPTPAQPHHAGLQRRMPLLRELGKG